LGLLAALAGGAGGELGRQAWAGLSDLVRQPFHRTPDRAEGAPDAGELASGESEMAALEQAPDDRGRALALRDALAVRAAADEGFAEALEQWHRRTVEATGPGTVNNSVRGGVQHGPILQGRNFGNISFTATPVEPAGPAAEPPAGAPS
jgi:hypothetical protein